MDNLNGNKYYTTNEQFLPETPVVNLIGNADKIVFDPNNLQPFVTFQAPEKDLLLPVPVSISMSSQLGNNLTTDAGLAKYVTTNSVEIRNATNMGFLASTKKLCPLEMSIKAANLDAEFENNSFSIANGVNSYSNGKGGFTTIIQCQEAGSNQFPVPASRVYPVGSSGQPFPVSLSSAPNNSYPIGISTAANNSAFPMTIASANPSSSPFVSNGPLELTIQPAVEPMRVVLLQVPSVAGDGNRPTMLMNSSSPKPALVSPCAIPSSTVCNTRLQPNSSVQMTSSQVHREQSVPSSEIKQTQMSQGSSIQRAQIVKSPLPNNQRTVISREQLLPSSDDSNRETMICEVEETDDESSSSETDESEEENESLVLKIRKVAQKPNSESSNEEEEVVVDRPFKPEKPVRIRLRQSKSTETSNEDDWSGSDDEPLSVMVKDELANLKCCPRRCPAKVQMKQRQSAFRHFRQLETDGKGDHYLAACLELVSSLPVNSIPPNTERPPSPWPSFSDDDDDMSEDIANESNGNPTLCDEIQNAIKESLKDQESAKGVQEKCNNNKDESSSGKCEKKEERVGKWKYSLIVNNRQRIVCLDFLLTVLNVPKARFENLQKRIIAGEPLEKVPITLRRKTMSTAWVLAKKHLDTLHTEPVPKCRRTPPHKLITEDIDTKTLFDRFCQFYRKETNDEVTVKFEYYRRFLRSKESVILQSKEADCSGCLQKKGSSASRRKSDTKATVYEVKKVRSKEKRSKEEKSNGDPHKRGGTKKGQRRDVFSLMISHLMTVPCVIPPRCRAPQPHKYFSPANISTQVLYEEYRKFFLKETKSELGLRYAIYESLFLRNPYYCIADINPENPECPRCQALPASIKETNDRKHKEPLKRSNTVNR